MVYLLFKINSSEQVHCDKLLGIYLSDTLQFETHLVNLLKICSHRTYLLKLLRDQGMPRTVHTLILFLEPWYLLRSHMHYQPGEDFILSSKLDGSIPFLSEHINVFFFSQLFSFLDLADDAVQTLFNSMLIKQHCFQVIIPEVKTNTYSPFTTERPRVWYP